MKNKISIIGGGPSAFLLACFLDSEKFSVTIYEKNKTFGRKFLVAGKGGFNLTHSETTQELVKRYTPTGFLNEVLQNFTNNDFRNWLETIAIPTYIGSSKRVYPKQGIKPIEVLNAITKKLKEKGVVVKYEHTFSGWNKSNDPIINDKAIKADYTIFCLGGASWKVTGSDGKWLDTFSEKGIQTKIFQGSNCVYKINWDSGFIKTHEGTPLKNIAITCDTKLQKGEAVITKFGLEGNAVYGLSPLIRAQLAANLKAAIYIDFKPSISIGNLYTKMQLSSYKNTTQILKKELKLSVAQIDLLKTYVSKEEYLNKKTLAQKIKNFPLEIVNAASIDESISTVGGIGLSAISQDFELKEIANQFCIGEMLDWDAPTGGYLLQACASSGVYLARYINQHNIL